MSTRFKNPWLWLRSLFAAGITGGATAALAWPGMVIAKEIGFNVPAMNWQAIGVVFISGALPGMFAYLQKSPLPEVEVVDTAFIKKDDVKE
jgi:shikimate kinase